eukprot:COSAG04_NODE_1261_length_7504_cov_2.488184_1_plen_465_part_10
MPRGRRHPRPVLRSDAATALLLRGPPLIRQATRAIADRRGPDFAHPLLVDLGGVRLALLARLGVPLAAVPLPLVVLRRVALQAWTRAPLSAVARAGVQGDASERTFLRRKLALGQLWRPGFLLRCRQSIHRVVVALLDHLPRLLVDRLHTRPHAQDAFRNVWDGSGLATHRAAQSLPLLGLQHRLLAALPLRRIRFYAGHRAADPLASAAGGQWAVDEGEVMDDAEIAEEEIARERMAAAEAQKSPSPRRRAQVVGRKTEQSALEALRAGQPESELEALEALRAGHDDSAPSAWSSVPERSPVGELDVSRPKRGGKRGGKRSSGGRRRRPRASPKAAQQRGPRQGWDSSPSGKSRASGRGGRSIADAADRARQERRASRRSESAPSGRGRRGGREKDSFHWRSQVWEREKAMRLEYRRLEHEEEETIQREEALAAGTGGRYYELKGARRMNEREFFESLEERNAE